MDSIRRNVYLAASFLVLGSVMIITGVSLYFSEDEDADGEAFYHLSCYNLLRVPGTSAVDMIKLCVQQELLS